MGNKQVSSRSGNRSSWLNIAIIILLPGLVGCTATKPWYSSNADDRQQNHPAEDLTLTHRIFLLGDTGAPKLDGRDPTLSLLREMLSSSPVATTSLFLGDNIYPRGIVPESMIKARRESEERLQENLQAFRDSEGRAFFIPGNHDWYSGWKGLAAQDSLIETYHSGNDQFQFLPEPGCPGPEIYSPTGQVTVVFIDSQWFLFDDREQIASRHRCSNKTAEEVTNELKQLSELYADKILLVATHHPFYANATHGGYFPLKDHIFPLTNIHPALYLPLPVVGSIYPLVRNRGVSRQDLSHRAYRTYLEEILAALSNHPHPILASGHEHILQYSEVDGRHFIISGSGTKTNKPRKGNTAEFVSPDRGFVTLDIYDDGSVWAGFWSSEHSDRNNRPVFRIRLFDQSGIQ